MGYDCLQRGGKLIRFDSHPEHIHRFAEFCIDSHRCLEITGGSFEPKVPGMLGEAFGAQE